jgi:hypothetical protein
MLGSEVKPRGKMLSRRQQRVPPLVTDGRWFVLEQQRLNTRARA